MKLNPNIGIYLATLALVCLFNPNKLTAQQNVPVEKGLKDYYSSYFPIGVAVTPQQLKDSAQRRLILTHFNSLTAENAMKMGPIHPQEDRYEWTGADAIVNFAVANGLKVRGHNLCWHSQVPKWMFYDKAGNLVTKEVLLGRLKEHIKAVVGRYKGKIYAWDVVNEAVSDNPKEFLRNSLWYQICGEDFIAKAFEYAHEADPKAILFYNDYNTESPEKRQRIFKLLKKLIDAGVPVHAVGLQGHWSIKDPSKEMLGAAIQQYADLGIKVQVTELDVSIYTDGNIPENAGAEGASGFSPELQKLQANQYANFFQIFRQYKGSITGVTFWNLSDRYSWLDNFPVRGRKNYPLLFDKDLQPKAAYWNVVKF
ncbi:endo-1,4-beta-xylanase [Pedobacter foliorum]|uniref:endo-1,4-beta-xylanase n=1 Tax=Pedobacter foliorum TaxID=2739058 RepID=UPI0015677188|nr:endo-1,4-beta-xylanase [Pedobacter foliorum]NRF39474.1 endo-1,4-beta-xylanase [Pedobacter foliorum]